MIHNYIMSAFRSIKKQLSHSIITLLGIAIGLGIFLFFWLIADIYRSYDTFHSNSKQLYGVVQVFPSGNEERHTAITPGPLMDALQSEFPEIEDATRLYAADNLVVKSDDKIFYEKGSLFVDHNFMKIFSFKLIKGNPTDVLENPNSMVISESSVKKYFGDENPIGRILTLNNKVDLVITGVVQDQPINSSIRYDFIVNNSVLHYLHAWMDDWSVRSQTCYLLLPKNFNPGQLNQKFPTFLEKYYEKKPGSPSKMYLLPLEDFFLRSGHIETFQTQSLAVIYQLLFASGVAILLVVCFNYMSLATAQYITRFKEVGMRKVVGAKRANLIMQFISESVLITFLSLPFAIIVYELLYYNFAGSLNLYGFGILNQVDKLIILVLITLMIGITAGIYPAFYMSSAVPVKALKNTAQNGKSGQRIRKLLVISQFSLAIILIIFAATIHRQFKHILEVDLGYNRKQVGAIQITNIDIATLNLLKTEYSKHSGISGISGSVHLPGQWDWQTKAIPDGFSADDSRTVNAYGVDYGFIELYEMKLLQGRNFSEEFDDKSSFIINQKAVQEYNWNNPIGKHLTLNKLEGTIVGVVEDFLFRDIHYDVIPSVLYLDSNNLNHLLVKMNSSVDHENVIAYMKNEWKKIIPDKPFDFALHESYFYENYNGINTIAYLCGSVGIIGILFSCFGIFALASYTVKRRIKEIGIRKVVGATEFSVILLLLKDFIKYIIYANIIALPLAYLISEAFLNWGFSSRTGTGVINYILVFIATVVLALGSVSIQTIRVTYSNPIDSLRYE